MKERAVQFGKYKTLVGIITEPEGAETPPAVLLLNAGMIHRIGPNRVYVKLARQLAAAGHRVLRMDISGIGDSQPRPDHMPVEQFTIDDVVQAMDYLGETHGAQSFVLMGHCAGAFHSFRTACQDPRVRGVVLINPDGNEADWVAYDRQRKLTKYYGSYYGKAKLLNPETWRRLLSGQIAVRKVLSNIYHNLLLGRIKAVWFRLQRRLAAPPPVAEATLFTMEAILGKLSQLTLPALLIYSEGATSLERIQLQAGQRLKQLQATGQLRLAVIPRADHTFTLLESQADLLRVIAEWAGQIRQG